MATQTALYAELNRAWKSTSKEFFGEELGELPDETYLAIRTSIAQHISEEMLKQGKDKPIIGESTAVIETENAAGDTPSESKEAKTQ